MAEDESLRDLGRRGNGFAGLFLGEAFKQLDVVAVVAGDRFEDDLQGEVAALGMGGGAGKVFGLDRGEEANVPGANGLVGGLGGGKVVGGVAVTPAILIEGLERGIVGAQGLAKAPAPDNFCVGEVRHQLAEAPLVLAWGVIDLFGGIGGEELAEMRGGFADDVDRFATFKVVSVWVFFHEDDGSTRLRVPTLLASRRMIRIPERLSGEDVVNANTGKEHAEIAGASFHAWLLGDLVAEKDDRFRATFRHRVANVLADIPLGGLAGDQHLRLRMIESCRLLLEAAGTRENSDVGDKQVRIAFNARRTDAELCLEHSGEGLKRGGRDGDEVLAVRSCGMGIAGPSEGLVEAVQDAVAFWVCVDLVVQAIDDEVMLLDEGALGLVDGIVGELRGLIAVVIEGGLVADDEVVSATDGFAEDVQAVEEGSGDAGDGRRQGHRP